MKKTTLQWVIASAVILWGLASILVLMGEDVDGRWTVGQFLMIKAAALASLVACYMTGRYCDRHGLLPNVSEEEGWL